MNKAFSSAGARPPETVYVESQATLDDGSEIYEVAVGLGFEGLHYVGYPNALVTRDNNYVGLYEDVARVVNRIREPRKEVTTLHWTDVTDWAHDERHREVTAGLTDGRKLCFSFSSGADRDFYSFGENIRKI